MSRFTVTLAVAATLAFGVCSTAAAAAPNPVADCNANTRLTRQYTAAELQHALSTMPADVKEYTDCYDVIQRALLAEVSGSHNHASTGSGGSGGSFLPTPVIVVIVVLVVAAAGFGILALRRRGGGGGGDE